MLTTNCIGCIFNNKPGCLLEKDLTFNYQDEAITQHTEGFCRHKRDNKWLEKTEKELSDSSEIIEQEESTLAVVIVNLEDINGLKQTISTIPTDVKQLVIVCQNADSDQVKEYIDFLKTTNFFWNLDNITDKILVSPVMQSNYASRLLKTHWFFALESGEEIDQNMIDIFRYTLKNIKNNFVSIYKDKSDNLRIIVNKFAFMELAGNADKPWFEKIQEFSNWKDLCLKQE